MEPRRWKFTTFIASHTSFPLRHYVTLNTLTLPTARTDMILNSIWTSHEVVCTIEIFGLILMCISLFVGRYSDWLRAGRSGMESRWGRDFPPVQTGPGAHPASCKMGTGYFPGVKCGRGVLLTTHPLLVPRSWKSRAIPLPTLWATLGL